MPTVTVPLTQGKFATIDAEDWPRVGQFRWYARLVRGKWYAGRSVPDMRGRQRLIHLHRFILDAPDGALVDHADGDGLNNARGNLRLATTVQNAANRVIRSDNRTGFKGVGRRKGGRFIAEIVSGGQRYYLGRFGTAEDAARAYDAKARELFGEFAHCNFPERE